MSETFTASIEYTKHTLENTQASMDGCLADIAPLGYKWNAAVGFVWKPNNPNDVSAGHELRWRITFKNSDEFNGQQGEPGNVIVVGAGKVYMFATTEEFEGSEFA